MADEKEKNNSADENTPEEKEELQAGEQDVAAESSEAEAVPETGESEASAESSAGSEPSEDAPEDANEENADKSHDDDNKVVNEQDVPEDEAEAAMMEMLEGLPEEDSKADVDDINFTQPSVSKVELQHLSEPAGKTEMRNIDLLMDVNLPISIELGRTKMCIADILALGPGSVVELNKLAGEPVDLLVNQKIIAKGEVVVIDENFGVRVTQLMSPEERLIALGEDS